MRAQAHRRAVRIAAIAAVGAAVFAHSAFAVEIGVASSVRNDVRGALGETRRDLSAGDPVSLDEVISTGPQSAAQLLFEDSSTLTLGARARLALTRFIYDPDAGAGDVVTEVIEGGFRFVSGVARPGAYQVETPRLTIGVRGSIVEGYVDPGTGVELIVLVQGAVDVCLRPSGPCVLISRPGDFVRVTADGIVGPERWPGPLMDQDAAIDFARYVDGVRAFRGGDPLPEGVDQYERGLRSIVAEPVVTEATDDDEFVEEEEEGEEE